MKTAPDRRAVALAKRSPHIPCDVMMRMQAHLRDGEFPQRGMPAALQDFYCRLAQAELPPDLVTEEIYEAVATSRSRLRALLKGLRMFAPEVPLSPAESVTQRWDAWLNARYNAKVPKAIVCRRVGVAPQEWPKAWLAALPSLDRTVRPYGTRMPRLAPKTRDAVISAVGLLARSREWAATRGVAVAPEPSADLFEAFFRFLMAEREVSFRTAADYCERLRLFFLRAGLLDRDSLAALADLTGALAEEATERDLGKWALLRVFRKSFALSDVLHSAMAAAREAAALPGHTTTALRLRQKAVSYALLVNTGDRQGDLRQFIIGTDLLRDGKGNWHHAIRQSKTQRQKEIGMLWPGTSTLIDAHVLADRPTWMLERRVAELDGANLLTLGNAVLNKDLINRRLRQDFGIHGHLVRTLVTDLVRRERPHARWAAQHMLGHTDRYMQDTYRSDFDESSAVQAMDRRVGELEAICGQDRLDGPRQECVPPRDKVDLTRAAL